MLLEKIRGYIKRLLKGKKVGAYTRVSSQEVYTLEEQEKIVQEYSKYKGYTSSKAKRR